MEASIVIRTLNEQRWLPELLTAVANQKFQGDEVEVVIVDSGSTDDTLKIAERFGSRVVHIRKEDFTFGRSLNVGCEAARGRCLVFVSGHCIPVGDQWLEDLVRPLREGRADYVYGRQEGFGPTKYSEIQLFKKYYPARTQIPQADIFCNNANAALLKSAWRDLRFDEALTGLEDMELAKRLVATGRRIGYVSEASVHHIHEESWRRVRTRYEREALALQRILPEVHVSMTDCVRYFVAGVLLDWGQSVRERVFLANAWPILAFRGMQYWGTWRGNNEHRQLSMRRREAYFYPR